MYIVMWTCVTNANRDIIMAETDLQYVYADDSLDRGMHMLIFSD